MATVTAKKPAAKPKGQGAGRKAQVPEPAGLFGNYRCYREHPKFRGRPCNRWLRAGRGAWAGRCDRCGGEVEFKEPNDPIR